MEISGPPQNGGLEFSRVDRVEILEQGSGSGFKQVCPDGYVYNLEIEGNNNYFANGVLVHNCHQFKSKSSDRGIAFHQLVGATKYTLTLTGTFFGGKSTSIFWLLHRLNAGVRRDFAFNDEKRWARLYGVLEMTRRSKRATEDGDEDGFTGNRRYQNQAKEKPGISPAIVNRLLDTTVFLSLKDLGLALPHYAEEVVPLSMTDIQSDQYLSMEKQLRDLAIKNRRYLSTWLQWSLARPNSAFRDEVVEVDERNREGKVIRKKELMQLPAIVDDERMPKEEWLVDFCCSERQQGRKVLIYLRQTGTRDIQDRILTILRDRGVRAEVLTSGINPRKREEWIAKKVFSLDALVVNPRLVETGLDLVAFSSVVFAEIEYSLYTLWQAVRRVWRLGQTKPVKAIFSVYNGAMEARALALMGQKMKAAQLLYGEEVGGAIVPEDDSDILMKLAREALETANLPDLQSLFADEVVVSNSPMGCPTAPSIPLPTLETPKVISWADWIKQRAPARSGPSRGRTKQVAQNQISLF
jgi:helicase-like protein